MNAMRQGATPKRPRPRPDYHTILVNDHTASFVVFQATAAAMLGGAILSMLVAASATFGANDMASSGKIAYSATLSAAICSVAYVNYSAMTSTRLRTIKLCRANKRYAQQSSGGEACASEEQLDGFVITALRYSDWVVTLPLLALKLFGLACDGPSPLTTPLLLWTYIHALLGGVTMLMIVFGFVSLLATGDFEGARTDSIGSGLVRWLLCLMGTGCLAFVYYVLFTAAHETQSVHAIEVIGFSLVWVLYPVVFVLQVFQIGSTYKDIAFAILDVLSKPLLSVYLAQAALKASMLVG